MPAPTARTSAVMFSVFATNKATSRAPTTRVPQHRIGCGPVRRGSCRWSMRCGHDLLDRRGQGEGEQRSPGQSVLVLGAGLRIGHDSRRVIVGRAGDRPGPNAFRYPAIPFVPRRWHPNPAQRPIVGQQVGRWRCPPTVVIPVRSWYRPVVSTPRRGQSSLLPVALGLGFVCCAGWRSGYLAFRGTRGRAVRTSASAALASGP